MKKEKELHIILIQDGIEIGTINMGNYLKVPRNRNKKLVEVMKEITDQGYRAKMQMK